MTQHAYPITPADVVIAMNNAVIGPGVLIQNGDAALDHLATLKAPDGNWYVPDPSRQGKYLQVGSQ